MRFLYTWFVLSLAMSCLAFAQPPNQDVEQEVLSELVTELKSLPFQKPVTSKRYVRKCQRLLTRIDAYLITHPATEELLYYRANVYINLGMIDAAVSDYKAMIKLAPEGKRGLYALNITYWLYEIVKQGRLEYQNDCCYFNSIRRTYEMWTDDCIPLTTIEIVCACDEP
ncbi:MAG: hypothetical protein AAFR59_15530 [Bacteroidota bacterium]